MAILCTFGYHSQVSLSSVARTCKMQASPQRGQISPDESFLVGHWNDSCSRIALLWTMRSGECRKKFRLDSIPSTPSPLDLSAANAATPRSLVTAPGIHFDLLNEVVPLEVYSSAWWSKHFPWKKNYRIGRGKTTTFAGCMGGGAEEGTLEAISPD